VSNLDETKYLSLLKRIRKSIRTDKIPREEHLLQQQQSFVTKIHQAKTQ